MTSLCSRFANYSKLLEPNNVHGISEREREREVRIEEEEEEVVE